MEKAMQTATQHDQSSFREETHVPSSYKPEDIPTDYETHEEPQFLSAWKLILLTFALCLLIFCVGVDNTIISTAIPKITDHFHALEDVGWYASAYLLTVASFQLIYGRLFTLFSIKWVYLIAIMIFEIGSFICGIAPSSVALIIGRAIAGVGGAGLFTGSMIIITQSVPPRAVPLYMGAIASVYGVAGVCGPLLGGLFTDSKSLTWRWAFYINCPLGAAAILAIVLFYNEPKNTTRDELSFKKRLAKIDIVGTVLLLPGVILLVLGITWGGIEHPWKSAHVISTIMVGSILCILFIIVQARKGERATISPRIFKNRNVYGATFFGFFLCGSFFVLLYYIPIWFQAIKNVSASRSGILNLPMIVGMVIFLGVTGLYITIAGVYAQFYYIAPVFAAIGMGLCSILAIDSSSAKYICFQALAGIGFGFGMMLPLITMQTCLEGDDVAIGVSIMMFGQTLGAAVLMSGAQNVFIHKLSSSISAVMPDLDARVFLLTGATKIREMVPAELLDRVLLGYNSALTDAFKFGTAIAAVSILAAPFMEWKSIKGKPLNLTAV